MMPHRPPDAATARIYGSPGARLRSLGLLKSLWPLFLIFMAFGYLLRTLYPYPQLGGPVLGGLFLGIGVFVAAAANTARRRLQNHVKGARGEETTARALATLPRTYRVLHGVALHPGWVRASGGADIDHVVIGPNGVFAIETKHWYGTLSMQGGELLQDGEHPDVDPFEQTRAAARCLQQFLQKHASLPPPPIIPILVFSASHPPEDCSPQKGVVVTHADTLPARIVQHVSQPSTALTDTDTEQILQTLLQKVEV